MAAATAKQRQQMKTRRNLDQVDRKKLNEKVTLDLPLDRREIAAVLGRSVDWVDDATKDGRLSMNPRIGRMTMSQLRADLARRPGRR